MKNTTTERKSEKGATKLCNDERLYRISGNTLGNHYGLPKLMWINEHYPDLYQRAHKFLLWGSFVSFLLRLTMLRGMFPWKTGGFRRNSSATTGIRG